MSGAFVERNLTVKCAERWGFFIIIVNVFTKFANGVGLGGRELLEAGKVMAQFCRLLRTAGMRLATSTVQDIGVTV